MGTGQHVELLSETAEPQGFAGLGLGLGLWTGFKFITLYSMSYRFIDG